MARLAPNRRSGLSSTPRALGFRTPAEWEPHEATWIAWPRNRSDWPGKFAPVPWVYAEIVRRLARVERVRVLVGGREEQARAETVLRKAHVEMAAVEFFHCATDRSWTRDYCPIFLTNDVGELALTKWRFNGWAKYGDWPRDEAAGEFVAARVPASRTWCPAVNGRRLVLEGGAIDVNGRGAVLTTEECLLSDEQARNPGLTREQVELALCEYVGASKVLWLKNGIAGDDTHGHVDDLARFTDPHTVVIVSERHRSQVNYEPLRENLALLRRMTDQNGRPLRVVTLPMPEPVYFNGQRLPASYANFYIANRLVLVPTFDDPNDRAALNTLARLLPDREIVGICCTDLVLGLGTLHCMTMQQPAASVSRGR